jgi:peptide/nickel transport system permease protein
MVAEETALAERVIAAPGSSRALASVRKFIVRKPLGALCGLVILLLIVTAAIGPWIAPYSYDDLNIPDRLQGPSGEHFTGTDAQGRDTFSRIIYGARTSVITGFGAVALSTVVATTLGIISGYKAGWFDTIVQRMVDIWQAFPGLIFIIFMVSIIGPGQLGLIIIMGLLFAGGSARLIRGATIAVSAEPYIEAAKSIGASDLRIWLRYVLPNVAPIILVSISVQVGGVILAESSLSFLGYGVPPPFPSWGRMLQEGQRYMTVAPWLALYPGLSIAICVYAFSMFGDALRDVLDPRLRGARG